MLRLSIGDAAAAGITKEADVVVTQDGAYSLNSKLISFMVRDETLQPERE